jgi:hypothetical protein
VRAASLALSEAALRASLNMADSYTKSVLAQRFRNGILVAMKFRSTFELGGKTATGIPVPEDVVAAWSTESR